jgi:hypothetical protein
MTKYKNKNDYKVIDFSNKIPRLDKREVTIFDAVYILKSSSNSDEDIKEMWQLTDSELNEIKNYIQENQLELNEL